MDKCRKSRCAQDFIARKINVNNYRRNLIKSRLEGVTCRSDALWRKSQLRHSNKKEDLGLATGDSPPATRLNVEGPEKLGESRRNGSMMNMKPECVKNSVRATSSIVTLSLLMNANF